MTIEDYFGDWSKVVDLKEADRIARQLSASTYSICPKLNDVFKAFRLCPLNNLRAVLIGQDPYPQKGVATGLAFANAPDTQKLSPSLEVLRESVIDYTVPHGITTFDPSLEKWSMQGILLLNSALSCEVGKPGSHMLLWRPFIKSLLVNLSRYHTGIVYLLMGAQAQSLEDYINRQFNYVIKIRHPSWYARNSQKMPHTLWKYINQIVKGQENYEIEWYEEY